MAGNHFQLSGLCGTCEFNFAACVRAWAGEWGWVDGWMGDCLCGAARTPFELRQNVTITHIDCWFLLLFAFFLKKPLFYAAVDFSNMRFIIRTHTHKNEKLEKSKKEREHERSIHVAHWFSSVQKCAWVCIMLSQFSSGLVHLANEFDCSRKKYTYRFDTWWHTIITLDYVVCVLFSTDNNHFAYACDFSANEGNLVYHFGLEKIIHFHRHNITTIFTWNFHAMFAFSLPLSRNILSMQTHEQETTNRNNGNSMPNHTLPCEWNEETKKNRVKLFRVKNASNESSL